MPFRWRPMQPSDVAACAGVVANHPIVGPRYGPASRHLERVWRRLLSSEAMTTAVYEDLTPKGIAFAGFGVGVFVSDQFVLEIKAAPPFWFGPVLCSRIDGDNSPVLSDKEVQQANAGQGLNELVWEALPAPGFAERSELYHMMGRAYVDLHRGYLFKEMITAQAEGPDRLQWAMDAGGLLWDPSSRAYARSVKDDITKIARSPHVVGITRDIERSRPGSWVGSLFDYDPPRIGFSNGEQRMLRCVLTDRTHTNESLAGALGISLSTVKKLWLSIYDRVAERAPETLAERAQRSTQGVRGKDKVRLLLQYLEEHPSELRPFLGARRLRQPRRGA